MKGIKFKNKTRVNTPEKTVNKMFPHKIVVCLTGIFHIDCFCFIIVIIIFLLPHCPQEHKFKYIYSDPQPIISTHSHIHIVRYAIYVATIIYRAYVHYLNACTYVLAYFVRSSLNHIHTVSHAFLLLPIPIYPRDFLGCVVMVLFCGMQ